MVIYFLSCLARCGPGATDSQRAAESQTEYLYSEEEEEKEEEEDDDEEEDEEVNEENEEKKRGKYVRVFPCLCFSLFACTYLYLSLRGKWWI
jgi:hypothetical protein